MVRIDANKAVIISQALIMILAISSMLINLSISNHKITENLCKVSDYTVQDNNRAAINERTNNSINGIYFPNSAFCIDMSRTNRDGLFNTISHEYVHELIMENRSCGDEGCYEHFCKR